MVERGGLENRCTLAGTVGSNPTPSATLESLLYKCFSGFVRANRREPGGVIPWPPAMQDRCRYFNGSPAVIRRAVTMSVRYPRSLGQVEDLLFERGIDICHETVRSDVRGCDQGTTRSSSVVFAMGLAPGRGVGQDQWRDP